MRKHYRPAGRLVALLLLPTSLWAPSAHALFGRKRRSAEEAAARAAAAEQANPVYRQAQRELSRAPQPGREELEAGIKKATELLDEAERALDGENYPRARSLARSIAIEVRSRSGIETTRPEYIVAPEIISQWDSSKSFEEIPQLTRNRMAELIRNYKDGFYIDYLNLAKRSMALYLKILYRQMKAAGKLASRDKDYLREQLVQIHSIPLYLKTNDDIEDPPRRVLFDSEVVDSVRQYEFNRELLDLVFEANELGLTEDRFQEEIAKFKDETLNKFKSQPALSLKVKIAKFSGFPFTEPFSYSRLEVINGNQVAVFRPTYKDLPIESESIKKVIELPLNGAHHANHSPLREPTLVANILCRGLGFPSVFVDSEGSYMTISQVTTTTTSLFMATSRDFQDFEDRSFISYRKNFVETLFCKTNQ